jgi:hypothetical protein
LRKLTNLLDPFFCAGSADKKRVSLCQVGVDL